MIRTSLQHGQSGYDTPTTGPVTWSTPSWTPEANSQLVVFATIRQVGTVGDSTEITALTGNGLAWTRRHFVEGGQNQFRFEVWTAKGAATAGALTVTTSNGRNVALNAISLSEDTILSSAIAETGASLTTPSVSLTAPSTPGLWLIGYGHRANQLYNLSAGQSQHAVAIAGTGGSQVRATVTSVVPDADLSETFTAAGSGGVAIDWAASALAVKLQTVPPLTPSTFDRTPYAATSPWNRTLAQEFPGGVPVHPASATLIESIRVDRVGNEVPNPPKATTLSGDATQYTLPVYVVNDSYPLRTVAIKGSWRFGSDTTMGGSWSGDSPSTYEVVQVPMPTGDIFPARGTDSQVIIINTDTGDEWNFFDCAKVGGVADSTGAWATNANGHLVCMNAGRYNSVKTGSAIPADLTGLTPPGRKWGMRGAKVPYMTGLVRKWEVDAGVIQHPIAFAFDYPSSRFVSPATGSDGLGLSVPATPGGLWDVPEGARLRLKPGITIATKYSTPLARMLATAMRDYGLITIDNAGRPKIYFEYQQTAQWSDPAALDAAAQQISLDDLEVIAWDGVGAPVPVTSFLVGVMTAVTHGTDAAMARPATGAAVTWTGSVRPLHALPQDRWVIA